MIASSPAVSRRLQDFELSQIWIQDDDIKQLAREQLLRMKKEYGTIAIPLHAIVDPDSGEVLGRLTFDPLMNANDYLDWLNETTQPEGTPPGR